MKCGHSPQARLAICERPQHEDPDHVGKLQDGNWVSWVPWQPPVRICGKVIESGICIFPPDHAGACTRIVKIA